MEGVQDLMQIERSVTNRRAGHELSLVSLETLHLDLLPELRCIWKGLMPSNLTTLEVKECDRLTRVFTANMIAILQTNLFYIVIYAFSIKHIFITSIFVYSILKH